MILQNPIQHIFTMGHSTLESLAFLSILKRHKIEMVADVRSSPYSRYTPQFNRDILKESLNCDGLNYIFLGDCLGARPSEVECYVNGHALYDKIAETASFKKGLQIIAQQSAKSRIVLLCAEKEPLDCHRAILICRHLKPIIPSIVHILADGSLENHEQTEDRLLRQFNLIGQNLFLTREELLDEAYQRQGKRIEYKGENVFQIGTQTL